MTKINSINIYTRLLRDIFLLCDLKDGVVISKIHDPEGYADGIWKEISEYEAEHFPISTLDGLFIYNDIIRDCYRIENDEQYITAISIPVDFSDPNNRTTHKDHRLSCLLMQINLYESNNIILNRPKTDIEKQRFMLRNKKILSIEEAKLMGYEYFTDSDMDGEPENLYVYKIYSDEDIKEASCECEELFDIIKQDVKQDVKQLGANVLMNLVRNYIYEDDSYPTDEDYAANALEGCDDLLKQLTDKINQNMAKVKFYSSTGIKLHIPNGKNHSKSIR